MARLFRVMRSHPWAPLLLGLCAVLITLLAVHAFELRAHRDAGQRALISFVGKTNSYYQIHGAGDLTGAWSVIDMTPGEGDAQTWTSANPLTDPSTHSYYIMLEVPIVFARDEDGDGMDDWYEINYPFLNPLSAADATNDFDGDGVQNIDEYDQGWDPTDPLDPQPFADVSGIIAYTGGQSGVIHVLAVLASNGLERTYSTTMVSPGRYTITNLPTRANYWIRAFRDADGDGSNAFWEAQGLHASSPIYVDRDLTGVDVTLADSDTDGDLMPDWWELRYGLDASSGVSAALAGWWKFDESDGTNVQNSAGNDYHGHFVNGSTSAWVSGKLGAALDFDGVDDFVRVPQSPAIITGDQFTVSAYVYYDGAATGDYPTVLADLNECVSYEGIWLGYDRVRGGVAGTYGTCSGFAFPFWATALAGRWVHLVLTYDGATGRLYLDGAQVASGASSFQAAKQSELRIGWADDPAYSYHWKGLMDDVRVYTEALAGNDILSMYDAFDDPDGDGLSNMKEYDASTDPFLWDTDGDGLSDGDEVLAGTEPTVGESNALLAAVEIGTARQALGAASFELLFNRAALEIIAVGSAGAMRPREYAVGQASAYASGHASLAYYQTQSLDALTGPAPVIHVLFRIIGAPGTPTDVSVQFRKAVDADTGGAIVEPGVSITGIPARL